MGNQRLKSFSPDVV